MRRHVLEGGVPLGHGAARHLALLAVRAVRHQRRAQRRQLGALARRDRVRHHDLQPITGQDDHTDQSQVTLPRML